jgi:hypothetical protein
MPVYAQAPWGWAVRLIVTTAFHCLLLLPLPMIADDCVLLAVEAAAD